MSQSTIDARSSQINLLLVCLCFIFSGLAALIYQTVWARKFALVFGTSELAIASVLAAYMGGLALGAWVVQRRIGKVRRPLLWFASIEAGIALAALILVPVGHWVAETVLVAVLGGQPTPPDAASGITSVFYLLVSFLVLLIPTSLMGATLPLLVRYAVHHDRQVGQRIGLLYASNTSGAVAGALLGALVLLPALGLARTVWVAAAINMFIALLAYTVHLAMSARSPITAITHRAEDVPPERWRAGDSPAWVLPLMLFSGAISFLHEVLWTRMLGHLLGSSIYAFGVMLASFLAGIALGGGVGAALAKRRETSARWLAVSQLGVAFAATGAWLVLQRTPLTMESMTERLFFGFSLLFGLAFAIGLTYPLAVRVLARGVNDAASASARVYSWNTVGAIIGAVAGGFLIVPALRYEGSVQLAVIASCMLAILASFALFKSGRVFAAVVTSMAIVLSFSFSPRPPDLLLRYSALQESGVGELIYYDVGRSSAVVALRLGDLVELRTNGLPEAAIDIRGTSPRPYSEAWMAPLAVLARPQAQDMLIIGFGGGRVIEAVPPSVQHVDIIELEDKVIEANRLLSEIGLRDPLRDPLKDPRVNLIINDARGTLKLTSKKYDVIISQPSHPWTAGASHLYTREFMREAQQHLNADGVFVQWMNIRFLDEDLLRSLVVTLADVFPHVRVYQPEPQTLLFLASNSTLAPEISIEGVKAVLASSPDHYGLLGINAPEDLVLSLVLDDAGSRLFARDASSITDDNNRFAVRSVHDQGLSITPEHLSDLFEPYDPLQQADSFIFRESYSTLAFDYIGRRLHAREAFDSTASKRLTKLAQLVPDQDMQTYLHTLGEFNYSNVEEAVRLRSRDAAIHNNSDLMVNAELESQISALMLDRRLMPNNTVRDSEHIVVQAVESALSHDWNRVAQLDSKLAAIPWTSIWGLRAHSLRIEWRVMMAEVSTVADQLMLAPAVQMIDRMSLVEPDPGLYLFRARAAGNDPYILTESLFRYAIALLQGVISPAEVRTTEFYLLYERYLQLDNGNRVYSYHDTEVKNILAAAAGLLE